MYVAGRLKVGFGEEKKYVCGRVFGMLLYVSGVIYLSLFADGIEAEIVLWSSRIWFSTRCRA